MIAAAGQGDISPAGQAGGARRVPEGEGHMARYEINDVDGGAIGAVNAGADMLFELGMMYSTGRSVPADLVSAHKWFNLAALRGNKDAARHRQEIAADMSEAEIATAQRAARDWLAANRRSFPSA
jgi:uncharacterized protein